MISVSIVEGDYFYREWLVRILEEKDFLEIYGVYSSAEEAVQGLPVNAPDVAIVDIMLQVKSGIELIQTVKQHLTNTQFLIYSELQNDENIIDMLKAGASGYIMKGSTKEDIQNAILELYNGGSPMSPFIARKVVNLLHQKKKNDDNLGLSSRELEVLSLLSRGLLYKEISDQLNISANTVKNHCKNIYKRLHVQNKIEAINKFGSYNLQA